MPGIFDDARRGSGPIAPDPRGTGRISAKCIDNSVPEPKRNGVHRLPLWLSNRYTRHPQGKAGRRSGPE